MSIGTTIKRLRRERNMTQEQLADYLGVTSRAVSQWETDRTAPDISQLPVLAGVFNVSADVLLEIDNGKKEEAIRAFLLEYDRLSHDGKLKEKFDLPPSGRGNASRRSGRPFPLLPRGHGYSHLPFCNAS